jgi:hypothetical protein
MLAIIVFFGIAVLCALALFWILLPHQIKSEAGEMIKTLLGTLTVPLVVFASLSIVSGLLDTPSSVPFWLSVSVPLPIFVFNVWQTHLKPWAKIITVLLGLPSITFIFIFLPLGFACGFLKNCP